MFLGLVDRTELEEALDEDVAIPMLTQVDFRTGDRHGMDALTARAHAWRQRTLVGFRRDLPGFLLLLERCVTRCRRCGDRLRGFHCWLDPLPFEFEHSRGNADERFGRDRDFGRDSDPRAARWTRCCARSVPASASPSPR